MFEGRAGKELIGTSGKVKLNYCRGVGQMSKELDARFDDAFAGDKLCAD